MGWEGTSFSLRSSTIFLSSTVASRYAGLLGTINSLPESPNMLSDSLLNFNICTGDDGQVLGKEKAFTVVPCQSSSHIENVLVGEVVLCKSGFDCTGIEKALSLLFTLSGSVPPWSVAEEEFSDPPDVELNLLFKELKIEELTVTEAARF